jgi:uncharacterized protein YoxC
VVSEIVIAIAVTVLVVVGIFLVHTLIQIRNTARKAEEVLAHLERELPPLLREVRQAASHTSRIAEQVSQGTQKMNTILEAVGEGAEVLHLANSLLRGSVRTAAINVGAMAAGFRAGTLTLLERLFGGGDRDGR